MMLIDTHCHLDFPEFDADRATLIERCQKEGIEYIINIGSSLQGAIKSVELAQIYPSVYAAVGIHPHEADTFQPQDVDTLRALAKKDKVVAVGEIGLDYYKNYSQQENQLPLFIALVGLAKELALPLVIHSRQAQQDTLKVLKENMPIAAVVHCFSGDEDFLKACLELNFFISFTCNITYKKADNLRRLVKLAPLEKIFLETDAPYLSPEGQRGRRNDPTGVRFVAAEINRIKEISIEEVARVTTENAKKFFKLK